MVGCKLINTNVKKLYKMKNILKLFTILIVGLIVVSSCEKAEDWYGSPGSSDDTYVIFMDPTLVAEVETGETVDQDFTLGVKVWGNPSDAAITVDLVAGGEAVLGTHYSVASTQLTIPAGGTQAITTLTVMSSALENGDTLDLVFGMTASVNTTLEAATSAMQIIKTPDCPLDISNFTGAYICDEAGYEEYNVTFYADPTVPNRIWNTNFWDWPAAGEVLYYDFNDDGTNTITIPLQDFTFGDDVQGTVEGTGTFDPCLHTFICDYDVQKGGDNPTHHVFTPGSIAKSANIRSKAN
jgi:hypothetical protein